jgi:hypothetical protein
MLWVARGPTQLPLTPGDKDRRENSLNQIWWLILQISFLRVAWGVDGLALRPLITFKDGIGGGG